jgi:hypothetical protein
LQYCIGCSGWSYTSWQGPFYPTGIENSNWLKYYSSIQEKDFGTIQIDRVKEMKKVARNFRKNTDRGDLSRVRFSIVAANNHYAGFGPTTINIFRQLLGLEEVKWGGIHSV